jgi:hypothetical protein
MRRSARAAPVFLTACAVPVTGRSSGPGSACRHEWHSTAAHTAWGSGLIREGYTRDERALPVARLACPSWSGSAYRLNCVYALGANGNCQKYSVTAGTYTEFQVVLDAAESTLRFQIYPQRRGRHHRYRDRQPLTTPPNGHVRRPPGAGEPGRTAVSH